MKTKKKVVIVTSIIISLIIISSVTISNPLLVDRAFYMMGFQEQICFPIIDKEFQSNNVLNIATAADFGINKNSIKTLVNIQSSDPEIILLVGDLGQSTAEKWIESSKIIGKENVYIVLCDGDLPGEKQKLREYYDSNYLATVFAPMFPEHSRNVLWETQYVGKLTLEERQFPLITKIEKRLGSSERWREITKCVDCVRDYIKT